LLAIIGSVIAGLIAGGIIVIGAGWVRAPRNAASFGIPDPPVADPAFGSWVRVKGGRDITLGVLTAVVLAYGSAHLLGWFMLAAVISPLTDGTIVLRSGGPKSVAYGIHWATAAVMLAGAVLLLVS
jgi:hypothetical protein